MDHKTKYRSKKGLLPFIELNGEEIADSAIIIKELTQKFNQDIDAGLTQEQKNIAHATVSMIENHLVWVLFWWRTKFPESVLKGYKVNLQHALGTRIPNGILNFFFKFSYGRKVCAVTTIFMTPGLITFLFPSFNTLQTTVYSVHFVQLKWLRHFYFETIDRDSKLIGNFPLKGGSDKKSLYSWDKSNSARSP